MKSSFSWPGRPPAEMISQNANRLLTSILDGSPKRGAFYTSILDGTLKRGAFYTSILGGSPKRGAFCTSILGGSPKRGAFFTSILDGTLKRGAFFTSILDGSPKRGAFYTSILDGTPKRGAFFGRQGRGVSNTPSKRSRMGTRVAKGSQTSDSLSPAGPFGRAYAIRPYHATSKCDAFYTSYLLGTLKRGAFCTSYLVGTLKRDAFCLFYSSFLALMQEKKQKKIKASAEAGEVGRVHLRNGRDPGQIFRVHHWRGRNLSRVCLLFFRLLFLAYSFSYVSVLYFRSEGVHSDVP